MRLLIVDDNTHFLQAARRLLEREGITIVGVVSTGVDALRRADELRPDVTLVDIELGQESGFDLAQRLVASTTSRVVLISAYPESELADLIASSPADGFVSKSELSAEAVANVLGIERG